MNRLKIVVEDIGLVTQTYDRIKIYYDSSESGSFTTELTDASTRLVLETEIVVYEFIDSAGDSSRWYKVAYFKEAAGPESDKSSARQGGTEEEKIGYTFNNYTPSAGEWGKVYTADDIRYTMMFGIDCIGSDTAQSEFTDEQFDQIVLEAVYDFERLLTMDIRKRVYKTNPADTLIQARLWRNDVDYTDEEDVYDWDITQWQNFGFIQLRRAPIISVERCIWKSVVQGEIMDMIESGWLRINKQMGQINLFPTGGMPYGPYSVYGPLWSRMSSKKYPGGFEIDFTSGYKSSDFVPEDLRSVIGKWATVKSLAVIGDGLMAGFSSQSISLDGLSESFSSTQSATSAYFGARVLQYTKEIDSWLQRNRNKFGVIPMSFIGI